MHSLPDYLQPGLRLVFVGFNPSMRSAAVGQYYAGPGNVFWPLLYESGLLPTPLTYAEDAYPEFGIGLTDLVSGQRLPRLTCPQAKREPVCPNCTPSS
jgi:TDG/mug DNA glycosylase family protein